MSTELQTIVAESGLEASKAQVMLNTFQDYFKIAAEWEAKAKAIVVTDESQAAEMKMARAGRLFIRDKRIAIEKTRKELKEQSLRESKAIDGIANVLKALLAPIEEHLDKQEHFVELREKQRKAEEAERLRIEAEKKAEEERLAKEAAEKAERERIAQENAKLKAEAEAREKALAEERAKVEAERKEREAAEVARRQAEDDALRKQAEIDRIKDEGARKVVQQVKIPQGRAVECPYCHKTFNIDDQDS
jgi:uncharacterized secreted protein with C-terminal beta-propeller domain